MSKKIIHPLNKGIINTFTEEELAGIELLPKSEQRAIKKRRDTRLFDNYIDDPDWRLRGGGANTRQETLESTTVDGAQISNSTTETIIVPDFNIPAFYMAPGRTIRYWAFGVNSNVVTTPGTLTLSLRWGGVAGTVLGKTAAIVLDTTARTNALFMMFGYITCRTVGSSGTFMTGGFASVVNQKGSVAVASNAEFNSWMSMIGSAGTPIASGSAAVTVNTTTANLLSLTATFSVATNPTNLTCNQRILEVIN